MIEEILDYEKEAFFALNGSDFAVLDRFMWLFSEKLVWVPLAAVILFILVYKKGWKDSIIIVLSIVLVVTLCDQISSGFFKPFFERLRPTYHPEFMNEVETVLGYRGGKYGFISSHAANAFGFATYMALLFRHKLFSWVIISWALITAYSRIYLGVHFISDIVPGIILGIGTGFVVYHMYKTARRSIYNRTTPLPEHTLYTNCQKRIIVYGVFATTATLLVLNSVLPPILD